MKACTYHFNLPKGKMIAHAIQDLSAVLGRSMEGVFMTQVFGIASVNLKCDPTAAQMKSLKDSGYHLENFS